MSAKELTLLNCGVGEDFWESLGLQSDLTSLSQGKSVLNINRKDYAEDETSILWPPDVKNWLTRKDPDAGKDWRREEKGLTEDEMVGWHHLLHVCEFEQALQVVDGQGRLACCSPWGWKESDMTERLNWTELKDFVPEIIATIKRESIPHELIWYTRKYKYCQNSSYLVLIEIILCSTCIADSQYITSTLITPISIIVDKKYLIAQVVQRVGMKVTKHIIPSQIVCKIFCKYFVRSLTPLKVSLKKSIWKLS